MKILLFIPQKDIRNYFELIRKKYYEFFPKFIKYFYKIFIIDFPLNKFYWNYYYYANLCFHENDILFFTNNIVESANRSINSFYICSIKNFSLFEKSTYDIIDLYEHKHKRYNQPKFSVTKAINYYVKNTNINKLIIFKDWYKINEEYAKYNDIKDFLLNKALYYDEETVFIKEIENISKLNHYKRDYKSDSSVDSEEEVIFNYNQFDNNSNNNGGDDNNDDNDTDNNKNNINNSKICIMNKSSKNNKNNKYNNKSKSRSNVGSITNNFIKVHVISDIINDKIKLELNNKFFKGNNIRFKYNNFIYDEYEIYETLYQYILVAINLDNLYKVEKRKFNNNEKLLKMRKKY